MSDEVAPVQMTFKLNYPECTDCSLDEILSFLGDKLLLLPTGDFCSGLWQS